MILGYMHLAFKTDLLDYSQLWWSQDSKDFYEIEDNISK